MGCGDRHVSAAWTRGLKASFVLGCVARPERWPPLTALRLRCSDLALVLLPWVPARKPLAGSCPPCPARPPHLVTPSPAPAPPFLGGSTRRLPPPAPSLHGGSLHLIPSTHVGFVHPSPPDPGLSEGGATSGVSPPDASWTPCSEDVPPMTVDLTPWPPSSRWAAPKGPRAQDGLGGLGSAPCCWGRMCGLAAREP